MIVHVFIAGEALCVGVADMPPSAKTPRQFADLDREQITECRIVQIGYDHYAITVRDRRAAEMLPNFREIVLRPDSSPDEMLFMDAAAAPEIDQAKKLAYQLRIHLKRNNLESWSFAGIGFVDGRRR